MDNVKAFSLPRLAGKTFARTCVAALIGLIIYLGLSSIFRIVSTHQIGFAIWTAGEDGAAPTVERHYYTDPDYTEDLPVTEEQQVTRLYSDPPEAAVLASQILTQLGAAFVLIVFAYQPMWRQGDHDRNEAAFGRGRQDPLSGLKVGAVADIPAIGVYLVLWLGKLGVLPAVTTWSAFTLLNGSFLPYCYWIMAPQLAGSTASLSVWQLLALAVPALVLPVICHVGYTLGWRQFSIGEKLTFKKVKSKKR
ncbi:MAG: hypothetical protein ACOYJY_00510 [Acutalibacteraceae bacterium]|jgi:hypothetical protein